MRGRALQRSISTTADADRLAQQVRDQLESIRVEVPEGVAVGGGAAGGVVVGAAGRWVGRCRWWYVEVVVYAGELAVEQWRTATYDLRWEGGGWAGGGDLVSVQGPVPVRPAGGVVVADAGGGGAAGLG